MSERGAISKVRSSKLETRLSSSDDPVVGGGGIPPSLSLKRLGLSMPLGRRVVWMVRHYLDLGIDSNSLKRLGFVFLVRRNEPATSRRGKYASTNCFPEWA